MNELPSVPESKNKITRAQAIDACKKFVEQGITDPNYLDLEDPEVKAANRLFDQWQKQEDAAANGDSEAATRANLAKTMFYVDAGFTDREYLEEVLSEWLREDAQNAEKQANNPERVETRRQIAEAIKKIRGLLA